MTQDGWISVKDKIPDNGKNVLVIGYKFQNPKKGFWLLPSMGQIVNGRCHPLSEERGVDEDIDLVFTHWQALPPAPSDEEGQRGG